MTHVARLTTLASLLSLIAVVACSKDEEGGGPVQGAAAAGGDGGDAGGQGDTGGSATGGATSGGTGGSDTGGSAGETGQGGSGGSAGETGQGGTGGSAGETGQGGTGGSAGETGQGGTGGSAGETGQGGTAGDGGEPAEGGAAGDGGSGPTIYPNVDCLDAGLWFDETTGLCWEDDASTDWHTYSEAVAHCAALDLAGFSWRLPDIDALRSLIRYDTCVTDCSCSANVPGGACGLTAKPPACLSLVDCRDECGDCTEGEGPAVDGCYFVPELGGDCGDYWSSSPRDGVAGDYLIAWYYTGGLTSRPDYEYIAALARCVRDDS